ncbi:MAG: Transcriptional regulator, TetR family, partial [Schumannella sp.]|nr:Transcriptional regulator, TetR family [Schumannella sp.]
MANQRRGRAQFCSVCKNGGMTDPAVDETPGLRERKRLATRRAIQLAAIMVVRDRGLEATTVDEIAKIA